MKATVNKEAGGCLTLREASCGWHVQQLVMSFFCFVVVSSHPWCTHAAHSLQGIDFEGPFPFYTSTYHFILTPCLLPPKAGGYVPPVQHTSMHTCSNYIMLTHAHNFHMERCVSLFLASPAASIPRSGASNTAADAPLLDAAEAAQPQEGWSSWSVPAGG